MKSDWVARIQIHLGSAAEARRLGRTLEPEVAREVPRARAVVRRRTGSVILGIEACDTSALRAALNTYLSWIGLIGETERVARAHIDRDSSPRARPGTASSRST